MGYINNFYSKNIVGRPSEFKKLVQNGKLILLLYGTRVM